MKHTGSDENLGGKYGYEPGDPREPGKPGQDMQHNVEVFAAQIGEPPSVRVRYISKEMAIGYLQPMWSVRQAGIEYMKDRDFTPDGLKGKSVIPIVTLESDAGQCRIGATLDEDGDEGGLGPT